MSIDVHRALWQKLNEMYGNDANSMFVLSMGKYLNYADYSPTEFPKVAGHNTFELVDSCIACNVNYSPTGSRISLRWEQLLYQGKGPKATAEQKPAFEKARDLLYVNYETRKPTELYEKYLKAKSAFEIKKVKLMGECRDKYGSNWETHYNELLPATEEYQQFQALDREVSPLLQAIDEWIYGPLANVMAPLKNVLDDGKKNTYYYISMIPTNWYEWFDPDQPEDDSWINIIVDQHTTDNENQSRLYKLLGGKLNAPLDFASFLQIQGEGAKVKKVDVGDTQDLKIHLKVRSVQINRPWIDLSALKIQNWRIPGEGPGAWSTGVLDNSNNGSFPLLSTRMIVVRDITVTASSFSKEITDTLKAFNPFVDSAVLFGLFSYTPSTRRNKESHDLRYDEKLSSILLTGSTQVIGFGCILLPEYPA